jgi:DnaK suppressor protein
MTDPVSTRLLGVRDQALTQLAALRREYDGLVAASESSNADDEHDPEGATIGFERAQLAATIEMTRARIADLERAMSQLAVGDYGRCEDCGREIGAERLTARPSARTCISCAR